MTNIHSEIGFHPADWSIQRVDSLFDIQQGKSVSKAHREGDNQKSFLRTKNIFWGKIDFSELDHMHFTSTEETRLKLQAGDLLLCEGGDVGRTAIWNNQAEDCYYQNHLHRLRKKSNNEIEPQFALYWFWYAFEFANIYIGRSNVTTIPNLSQSKLSELQIPKPPLPEQRRIAHVLSIVQTAIEQQARLIALTRELKAALMRQLFTEGLPAADSGDNADRPHRSSRPVRSQKMTEIGLVPEDWEVVKLEDVCQLIVDCPHTTPNFQQSGVRVARNFNIRDGRFVFEHAYFTTEEEYRHRTKRAEPKPGDILFSREAPVGEACLIPQNMKLSLGQRTMLLRTNPAKLDPAFMVYNFYSPNVRQRILSMASGLTVAHLNVADVRSLAVPIPTISEQIKIGNHLTLLDERIEIVQAKKNLLEELFRTLLHHLMTGQARTTGLDLTGLGDL
ncbi:restriction modification system DNA specificity domain protein [Candidatus Moduliflexus flocculans]|uniref:Restriction modification system DNA specificity domain protein n=1 Tax=Candidatus Moduliflexus flocculans TaxID=1499966 RepID=A0A081BP69_9BACT|nr:restriction modification system DNA specificity domain protein [Candidatus Moduliflexus flocculans]